MQKKKMEELNLLDDFMFGTVMSYPGIGKEVCRKIVSVIIGREIKELRIVPQKIYYGIDTDKRGIRLDVYAEEESEEGDTVYDLEPDQNDRREQKEAMPKRARFYHAKIDASSLESGGEYSELKRVIIIFISPYDPFQLERMVYTVKNCCVEEPEMPYDDGAKTIFLYTRGTKGNPPEQLRKLLRYLEDSKEENADNAVLQNIHQMVQTVRCDKEVSLEYMKIFEREKMIRDEGKEEGKVSVIRMMIKKKISAVEIADVLELGKGYVELIEQLIKENPGADDEEIVQKMYSAESKR